MGRRHSSCWDSDPAIVRRASLRRNSVPQGSRSRRRPAAGHFRPGHGSQRFQISWTRGPELLLLRSGSVAEDWRRGQVLERSCRMRRSRSAVVLTLLSAEFCPAAAAPRGNPRIDVIIDTPGELGVPGADLELRYGQPTATGYVRILREETIQPLATRRYFAS